MNTTHADLKTKTAELAHAIGIKPAKIETRPTEDKRGTEILLPVAGFDKDALWRAFIAAFPNVGMVDLRNEGERHLIRIYDYSVE